MKQNYNNPCFILEELEASEDDVRAAFKALYPTYREAKLFALAGGSVFYRVEDEGAIVYVKGAVEAFSPSGDGGYISLSINDQGIDVEYASNSDSEGGGDTPGGGLG